MEATQTTDVFHLGGDEVNLECWSQYFNDTDLRSLWCDFMLQAYQKLRKANKNAAPPKFVIVWSSGLTSSQCLSRNNFAVQVWGGSAWQENYDLLMNGFNIIVSHVDAWYLDCGFGSWRSTGDGACSPYTTWQRVYKHRPWDRMHLDPIKMKQVRAMVCWWCVLFERVSFYLSFSFFIGSFAGNIRYLAARHVYGQNRLTRVISMLAFGQELPHSRNGKHIWPKIVQKKKLKKKRL